MVTDHFTVKLIYIKITVVDDVSARQTFAPIVNIRLSTKEAKTVVSWTPILTKIMGDRTITKRVEPSRALHNLSTGAYTLNIQGGLKKVSC